MRDYERRLAEERRERQAEARERRRQRRARRNGNNGNDDVDEKENDSDDDAYYTLGGPGMTVEIDESCFSKKRKYRRGHLHRERWVFGAVERKERGRNRGGKFRAWQVPNRRAQTLIPIITQHIHPETRIISDDWAAYHGLGGLGYEHEIINHSIRFVDANDPSVHTETIEGRWMHVKRHFNTLGGTRDEEIQERLDEYSFLMRYGNKINLRVWRILRCIATHGLQAKNHVDSLE